MSKQASDYKIMVIIAAFLAPVLGGAIIYYSLKKSHNTMAKLGNNMSFIAIVIWIAGAIGLGVLGVEVPDYIYMIIAWTGVALAVVSVVLIKKTPHEFNAQGE